mmetsp:Transcript_5439/g.16093  ORF Transcript_5439/g.16093 Transcript_5439/m.16093 type:complete len:254 (-) Transcript_5439:411-1172(-)
MALRPTPLRRREKSAPSFSGTRDRLGLGTRGPLIDEDTKSQDQITSMIITMRTTVSATMVQSWHVSLVLSSLASLPMTKFIFSVVSSSSPSISSSMRDCVESSPWISSAMRCTRSTAPSSCSRFSSCSWIVARAEARAPWIRSVLAASRSPEAPYSPSRAATAAFSSASILARARGPATASRAAASAARASARKARRPSSSASSMCAKDARLRSTYSTVRPRSLSCASAARTSRATAFLASRNCGFPAVLTGP